MPRSRKIKTRIKIRIKTKKYKSTRKRAGGKSPSPKKKSPSPKKIEVTVTLPNGDEETFHVNHKTTINQLKSMIEQKNGHKQERQILYGMTSENALNDTTTITSPMNLYLIIDFMPIESNKKLRELVNKWTNNENHETITEVYGDISNWNTSKITDMRELFMDKENFNENINDWDVSNVTNMKEMFLNANLFNKIFNNWKFSKVTNMSSVLPAAVWARDRF